jgi:hypothetical protein
VRHLIRRKEARSLLRIVACPSPLLDPSVWTTDGRWKETDLKINKFKGLGCLAVDMETAALYAFGMDRKIPVLSLNIVMDRPYEDCGTSSDHRGVSNKRVWCDTVMPLFLRLFRTVIRNIC